MRDLVERLRMHASWRDSQGELNDAPNLAAAEIKRLRVANDKLVADLAAWGSDYACANCEGCGAPLFDKDDYVSNDDVSGCWASMTDLPSKRERPCYAYRVGKPDAHTAKGSSDE